MNRDTIETPTSQTTQELSDLELCLVCFDLRGEFQDKEHRCSCQRQPDSWREKEWARYDITALVDLCNLCARGIMRSGSRYTWLVCDNCLQVNKSVGGVLGSPRAGALPVGRHSLMNGVAFVGGDLSDERIKSFTEWLLGLTDVWFGLFEWRSTEARRLADSADLKAPAIRLPVWLTAFPSSLGASVDAFCRYVEYDLPEHSSLVRLREARQAFVVGGD